jgi:HSP20 family protein
MEEFMKTPYAPEKFFDDLFGFRREFDEMFNRILTSKPWNLEAPEFKKSFAWFPAVETYVDKEAKKYVCRFTLPGVEPKDVQVHAQNGLLTIQGERKYERRTKETEMFHEEINYGVFERTIPLPEGVSIEKLNAEYVNGVLEITAPVAAAALPRKIEIKNVVPLSKQVAA